MFKLSGATKRMAKTLGTEFVPKSPMTPDKVSSVSEELENRIAAAMQKAREDIGATAEQRVAFAYAEAAMRSALRSSAPRTSEDAE